MKNFFAALAIVSVAFSAQAQGVSKTLVKSFAIKDAKAITIDIKNAQVDIKTSDKETMEVQTIITLKNGNEALYEQLAKNGRYNLALSDAKPPMLTAADRATVKVSGAELDEEIKYIVTVPKYVDAQNVNAIAFGGKKGKGKAAVKAAPKKVVAKKPAPKKAAATK
jgi:hypothetical protein